MPNPNILAIVVFEIFAFLRTDRHTDRRPWLDRLASDPHKEYIYFMGSETLTPNCCILSDESSTPFFLRVTGINITLRDRLLNRVLAY